jgi:hypothetical protein
MQQVAPTFETIVNEDCGGNEPWPIFTELGAACRVLPASIVALFFRGPASVFTLPNALAPGRATCEGIGYCLRAVDAVGRISTRNT